MSEGIVDDWSWEAKFVIYVGLPVLCFIGVIVLD